MTSSPITYNMQTVLNLMLGTLPDGTPVPEAQLAHTTYRSGIAALTGLSFGSLFHVLDRLVDMEMVEKVPPGEAAPYGNSVDRRPRSYYRLTAKGRSEAPAALASSPPHRYRRRPPAAETTPVQRPATGPCRYCDIIAGKVADGYEIIVSDHLHSVVLSTGLHNSGRILLIPRAHTEQPIGLMVFADYLAAQSALYFIAQALSASTGMAYTAITTSPPRTHTHWQVTAMTETSPGVHESLLVVGAADLGSLKKNLRWVLEERA